MVEEGGLGQCLGRFYEDEVHLVVYERKPGKQIQQLFDDSGSEESDERSRRTSLGSNLYTSALYTWVGKRSSSELRRAAQSRATSLLSSLGRLEHRVFIRTVAQYRETAFFLAIFGERNQNLVVLRRSPADGSSSTRSMEVQEPCVALYPDLNTAFAYEIQKPSLGLSLHKAYVFHSQTQGSKPGAVTYVWPGPYCPSHSHELALRLGRDNRRLFPDQGSGNGMIPLFLSFSSGAVVHHVTFRNESLEFWEIAGLQNVPEGRRHGYLTVEADDSSVRTHSDPRTPAETEERPPQLYCFDFQAKDQRGQGSGFCFSEVGAGCTFVQDDLNSANCYLLDWGDFPWLLWTGCQTTSKQRSYARLSAENQISLTEGAKDLSEGKPLFLSIEEGKEPLEFVSCFRYWEMPMDESQKSRGNGSQVSKQKKNQDESSGFSSRTGRRTSSAENDGMSLTQIGMAYGTAALPLDVSTDHSSSKHSMYQLGDILDATSPQNCSGTSSKVSMYQLGDILEQTPRNDNTQPSQGTTDNTSMYDLDQMLEKTPPDKEDTELKPRLERDVTQTPPHSSQKGITNDTSTYHPDHILEKTPPSKDERELEQVLQQDRNQQSTQSFQKDDPSEPNLKETYNKAHEFLAQTGKEKENRSASLESSPVASGVDNIQVAFDLRPAADAKGALQTVDEEGVIAPMRLSRSSISRREEALSRISVTTPFKEHQSKFNRKRAMYDKPKFTPRVEKLKGQLQHLLRESTQTLEQIDNAAAVPPDSREKESVAPPTPIAYFGGQHMVFDGDFSFGSFQDISRDVDSQTGNVDPLPDANKRNSVPYAGGAQLVFDGSMSEISIQPGLEGSSPDGNKPNSVPYAGDAQLVFDGSMTEISIQASLLEEPLPETNEEDSVPRAGDAPMNEVSVCPFAEDTEGAAAAGARGNTEPSRQTFSSPHRPKLNSKTSLEDALSSLLEEEFKDVPSTPAQIRNLESNKKYLSPADNYLIRSGSSKKRQWSGNKLPSQAALSTPERLFASDPHKLNEDLGRGCETDPLLEASMLAVPSDSPLADLNLLTPELHRVQDALCLRSSIKPSKRNLDSAFCQELFRSNNQRRSDSYIVSKERNRGVAPDIPRSMSFECLSPIQIHDEMRTALNGTDVEEPSIAGVISPMPDTLDRSASSFENLDVMLGACPQSTDGSAGGTQAQSRCSSRSSRCSELFTPDGTLKEKARSRLSGFYHEPFLKKTAALKILSPIPTISNVSLEEDLRSLSAAGTLSPGTLAMMKEIRQNCRADLKVPSQCIIKEYKAIRRRNLGLDNRRKTFGPDRHGVKKLTSQDISLVSPAKGNCSSNPSYARSFSMPNLSILQYDSDEEFGEDFTSTSGTDKEDCLEADMPMRPEQSAECSTVQKDPGQSSSEESAAAEMASHETLLGEAIHPILPEISVDPAPSSELKDSAVPSTSTTANDDPETQRVKHKPYRTEAAPSDQIKGRASHFSSLQGFVNWIAYQQETFSEELTEIHEKLGWTLLQEYQSSLEKGLPKIYK